VPRQLLVPTTHDFGVAHNVSIATAHGAIALLAGEGLIEVSRGRRARVKKQAADQRRHIAGAGPS